MKPQKQWPEITEVRSSVHDNERIKRILPGLFHFFLPFLVWICTLVAIVFTPWWAKIILGFLSGHAIGVMLLIGHDALHGLLFPIRWMNRLAGQISMAPAFHPVTSWVHSHNGLHHGFTNIKGKDAGFPPLSLAEYQTLSMLGKYSYRLSRTWYGCGWLYLKEMWFNWEFFPNAARAPKNSGAFLRDRLRLTTLCVVWIGVLVWSALVRGESPWLMVMCGFVIPQCVSNYLIGFITLQQHTHPKVPWYSGLDSPSPAFVQAQLNGTPHSVFPYLFRAVMRNVMEHTVHHADPAVPLYCLPEAQRSLEKFHGEEIVLERWTPFTFLKTTGTCKLYNYSTHQWIDYSGKPLTESLYGGS